jgi:predicted peroxiredoxin
MSAAERWDQINEELDSIRVKQKFAQDCINAGIMIYACEKLLDGSRAEHARLMAERRQLLFVPSVDLDRAALATS